MTSDAIVDYAVVIPTVGRETLRRLLSALRSAGEPAPAEVVVVDDRVAPPQSLAVDDMAVRVLSSGGRGPAAARNVGWRSCRSAWICFLDDDVAPQRDWTRALAGDLAAAERAGAAGSQGRLEVPRAGPGQVTDDDRRTHRLATARWITADMAYRRDVLVAAGGFDERFPRAYREDSDLAARITGNGHRILWGTRRSTHPVAPSTWFSSVRAQRGNRDDALLRRKYGRGWRRIIGEGPGRMPAHLGTTAAAVMFVTALAVRNPAAARLAATTWGVLTAEFTVRRWVRGPHTPAQAARLAVTSALIPPAAVGHRLAGAWSIRRSVAEPPLAVLFDRDDTLIDDGPYLNDPFGVRPKFGARQALDRLRERGLLLGVVSNQSGVARGLISVGQLAAVNARVNELLGPFDDWQMCLHGEGDGCRCRKPEPAMVLAAAETLGVPPARCVMIGDTGADVDAALAAGAAAVLVPTARTRAVEVASARSRAAVADTLTDAVSQILRESR